MCPCSLFTLFGPLGRGPALPDFFLPPIKDQSARGHILPDCGCGGNIRVVVDGQRGDQGRIRADLDAVSDPGLMLAEAVIVAGDRARPDIGLTADLGVANIGQVFGLGPLADGGFFDLNEIADLGVGGQNGAAPQMRKRPGRGVIAELAVTQHDREIEADMIAEGTVLNIGVAVNPTVRADDGPAFDMGIRTDDRVRADGRLIAQIDRLRVLKADTGVHPLAAELFLACCFHTSELLSRIDSFDFLTVRREHGPGRESGPDGRGHDVGQIVFALGIGGLETVERGKEKVGRNAVYPGVDFPDAALLGRGVPRLHDADHLAVGAANNPPVLSRVGALGGQDRQRRPVRVVVRDKARQRPGREQGHVTGDNQHIPPKAGKLRCGRADRVPGATLLFLKRKAYPVFLTRGLNRGGLMADHDAQVAGLEALAGLNDARQERFPGQMMQHLGPLGKHARPLARG